MIPSWLLLITTLLISTYEATAILLLNLLLLLLPIYASASVFIAATTAVNATSAAGTTVATHEILLPRLAYHVLITGLASIYRGLQAPCCRYPGSTTAKGAHRRSKYLSQSIDRFVFQQQIAWLSVTTGSPPLWHHQPVTVSGLIKKKRRMAATYLSSCGLSRKMTRITETT